MTTTCDVNTVVNIDGHEHGIDDLQPTGRQLLDKAGKRPVKNFVIYMLMEDGQMDRIGLDDVANLRKPGIEKFITFETDRIYRFILDGREFEWGAPKISGITLKGMAQVNPVE